MNETKGLARVSNANGSGCSSCQRLKRSSHARQARRHHLQIESAPRTRLQKRPSCTLPAPVRAPAAPPSRRIRVEPRLRRANWGAAEAPNSARPQGLSQRSEAFRQRPPDKPSAKAPREATGKRRAPRKERALIAGSTRGGSHDSGRSGFVLRVVAPHRHSTCRLAKNARTNQRHPHVPLRLLTGVCMGVRDEPLDLPEQD